MEDPVNAEVVAVGDGIEFVIVATGARDAEAEERFAEIVDGVVDGEVGELEGVDVETPGVGQVAGGDELLPFLGLGVGGEQVAGELFADELIV